VELIIFWAKNCLYINNQFQNFCIFYSRSQMLGVQITSSAPY
jgi:hypothetical protein